VYAKMGQLEEAVAWYSRASHQKPGFLPALLGMGNAYRRMGGHAEALAAFKRAQTVEPDNLDAQIGVALSLLDLHQPLEALEILERLVSVHAENPLIHEGLADAYRSLNRDSEVLAAREEAARLQPFSARAQLALGQTSLRLKQWKRAFAAFQRAVRLQPELPEAKAGLAEAHEHIRAEVEGPLTESVSQAPETDETEMMMATSAERSSSEEVLVAEEGIDGDWQGDIVADDRVAGEPDEEESVVVGDHESNVSDLHGNSLDELIEQGESQYVRGDYADALRSWEQALSLDATNPSLYNNCAAALLELGRTEDAVEACRKALALDSDYAVARVTLCEILVRQGNRADAEKELAALQMIDPELARQAEELFNN